MEHCNGFPTPTKVEAPLGTYVNGYEDKRDWPNAYSSVIAMILYLTSNTRPDISFSVHHCDWFTPNTKASHKTSVKRIFWYLQGTKDNCLFFNPYKKPVDCYADANFAGLWQHENPRDPICASGRTGFVLIFSNFPLLWVSKLQT